MARGAAQRLWQVKILLGQIDALFLTHLHSDHMVGIPDLWLTGWIPAVYGRRAHPLQVNQILGFHSSPEDAGKCLRK